MLKISEGSQQLYVEFYVDGNDLGERVRSAFGKAGFDDVLPWPGGDYNINRTVLGEPARRVGGKGMILFACGCGYCACSGVFADVDVEADTITIRNISTWHGGQNVVAPLDPLVFDRNQFEAAVQALERAVATWCPGAT